MESQLEELKTELRLRGYSENTFKTYLYHNMRFLDYCDKNPGKVSEKDLKKYIGNMMSDYSSSTVNIARSALKFFYDEVLGKDIVNFKSAKVSKKLPVVLRKGEVRELIDSAQTRKSQLMLEMLYSSGLRVSELVKLKVGDLELDENHGWVRGGKGGKDRLFILSKKLSAKLKVFVKDKKSSSFVFDGFDGSMTTRNVQSIVKRAALSAGIDKKVSPHTLRHCFATHLLESGVGIRQIQVLLGHSNLQTTQIYTKVSTEELKTIDSPLDIL